MPKETKRSAVSPLLIGGAVVIALVVAVAISLSLGEEEPAEEGSSGTAATEESQGIDEEQRSWGESLAHREADDPTALGEEDAPVVLVAYSDFACPFCASWAQDTQPELIERYVDSGDLRIEWREFPYLDEASHTLSIGALAAAEQDAFWQYQEAAFDNQDELTSTSEPREDLMEIADDLGLDTDRFATDLDEEELAQRVDEDFSQGLEVGVNAAPAYIINGDPVMGAQPLDVFVDSIDAALVSAGG